METVLERYGILERYLTSCGHPIMAPSEPAFCNLTFPELENLLNDVYDELARRRESDAAFLPVLLHLNQTRNQARQKLAKVDKASFLDLLSNVCGEYKKRILSEGITIENEKFSRNGTTLVKMDPQLNENKVAKMEFEITELKNMCEVYRKKYEIAAGDMQDLIQELKTERALTAELQSEITELKRLLKGIKLQKSAEIISNIDAELRELELESVPGESKPNNTLIQSNHQALYTDLIKLAETLYHDALVPNLPIVKIVRQFLVECKKFSDETERLELMGLLTPSELKTLAVVEKKLDSSLQSLLGSRRMRNLESGGDELVVNAKAVVRCIYEIFTLLDGATCTTDKVIAEILQAHITGVATSSEPLGWNSLVRLQQKQIDVVVKCTRILLLRTKLDSSTSAAVKNRLCRAAEIVSTETLSTLDVTEVDEVTYDSQTDKISKIDELRLTILGENVIDYKIITSMTQASYTD